MSDDDKPVNAAIRPVLPSRAAGEPLPAFINTPSPGTETPPPATVKESTVTKTPKKKDPRRSAAAKAIWAKRRAKATGHLTVPGEQTVGDLVYRFLQLSDDDRKQAAGIIERLL